MTPLGFPPEITWASHLILKHCRNLLGSSMHADSQQAFSLFFLCSFLTLGLQLQVNTSTPTNKLKLSLIINTHSLYPSRVGLSEQQREEQIYPVK